VAKIEAINEAVILHQLGHPCLTKFYGLTAEQSVDCTLVDMVIEYCPQGQGGPLLLSARQGGHVYMHVGTLGAYLCGPIQELDAESSQAMLINTAYQIFSGLAYLHSQVMDSFLRADI
jgi:serine/threonine protein kinase